MTYFVDTNYFLRLLIGEKTDQFQKVYALFVQALAGDVHLVTSCVVIFEIYWVLSSFYEKDKESCINALRKVLAMEFVDFPERNMLLEATQIFSETSLDLEDCYNIVFFRNTYQGTFATFDKKIISFLQK